MFALCVETSHERGMGHFFRMLNFADVLVEKCIPCIVLLNHHGPALELLQRREIPFQIVKLNNTNDWEGEVIKRFDVDTWINDRLDTNQSHAIKVKDRGVTLVTFDDKGKGAELADLNVAAFDFEKNKSLGGKKILRGIEYLILSSEIDIYKKHRTNAENWLITMGGSDTYGVTVKLVKMLKSNGKTATVVLGPGFLHDEELMNEITDDFIVKRNVPSLIKEFSYHDIAITGGGITPCEANASGMPCVIVACETFEVPIGKALENFGCSVFAGFHKELNESVFLQEYHIEEMSKLGIEKLNTKGSERLVSEILNLQ